MNFAPSCTVIGMAKKKDITKSRATTPLQELDDAARRRLEDLPDQPQAEVIRGFGAMNPIEGAIDKDAD